MSDCGLVAFYYDYEVPETPGRPGQTRRRGLVSRAYKYPEVNGMMLHAHNGMKHFLKNLPNIRFDIDLVRCCDESFHVRMENLQVTNMAFDVFFDLESICLGVDLVEQTLKKGMQSDEEFRNDLFGCEGTYGWLYITFTGNPQDDYELKYGYYFGRESLGEEWQVGDLRRAADIEKKRYRRIRGESTVPEDPQEVENAIAFFEENAELLSEEEFWKMEDMGIDCVKEAVKRHPQDEKDSSKSDNKS